MPETKPKTAMPDRKPYERIVYEMDQEASTWTPTWKDLKANFAPDRGFFDDQPNQGQEQDAKYMLDEHPVLSNRTLAAGMTSGLTSPSRPWFRLGVDNPDLMEIEGVKIWCDTVRERMMNVFSRSNLYGSLTSTYEELGAFSTGALMVLEDPNSVIRTRTFTIGEYRLLIGPDGRVNGFSRRYWETVANLVKEFGLENVSENVKTAYNSRDNKQLSRWVKVVHLVIENDQFKPDLKDNKHMAYASIQWEESSTGNTYLKISGFKTFPVMAPRWQTTTTADVYGKGSPGRLAKGSARMLQKLHRKALLGLDKTIDPPIQKDGMVSGDVDTLPGGQTKSSASVPNAGARPLYQIKIDLNAIEAKIEKTQMVISRAFYTDLFLMLSQIEHTGMTAREIAERHEEKLLLLSPVIENLEDELLDPLISRTYSIMDDLGLIPDVPPELAGHEIKIEYISVLAQAQKSVGTAAIEMVCGFAGQLMLIDPNVKAKIDLMEALEVYADMMGIPAKIVRSKEATASILKAMQDAELRAQQAQSGMIAAQGAETLSKAKIGPDSNGQNSALDAVLAALTGRSMPQKEQPAKQPAGATK